MKLKTLVVSVLLLAALSAAVYFMNRPAAARGADARLNQPVLQAASIETAAKIKISDQGKSVILTKQPDNSWRVTTYYDFPADFQKLSTFVSELTAAKVEQFVTANPERLSRLEFKDTQIQLLDTADKAISSLTLGKNAEAGGRFVRFGEEAKGYRANLNAWIDAESKNWADSNLVSVKPEEVTRMEIEFPGSSPVIVTRAKKEDPFTAEKTPAGQRIKADKVSSLLSTVTSLRFSETSEVNDPNAVAAKQNPRSVKVTTFDGKRWTIALGRKPEQKVIKAPAPKADGKTGPAALGSLSDATKPTATGEKNEDPAAKAGPAKALEPEIETIPAGPVYAFISSSDASAPINAMTGRRSFQVSEYVISNLPQKTDEFFEVAPPATPPPTSSTPNPAATITPPASK